MEQNGANGANGVDGRTDLAAAPEDTAVIEPLVTIGYTATGILSINVAGMKPEKAAALLDLMHAEMLKMVDFRKRTKIVPGTFTPPASLGRH